MSLGVLAAVGAGAALLLPGAAVRAQEGPSAGGPTQEARLDALERRVRVQGARLDELAARCRHAEDGPPRPDEAREPAQRSAPYGHEDAGEGDGELRAAMQELEEAVRKLIQSHPEVLALRERVQALLRRRAGRNRPEGRPAARGDDRADSGDGAAGDGSGGGTGGGR